MFFLDRSAYVYKCWMYFLCGLKVGDSSFVILRTLVLCCTPQTVQKLGEGDVTSSVLIPMNYNIFM